MGQLAFNDQPKVCSAVLLFLNEKKGKPWNLSLDKCELATSRAILGEPGSPPLY